METYAKVVADSISPTGSRLITFECGFPRFILPQFNTHRGFSRNSGSSRAIPVRKTIEQVRSNPVVPLVFGSNKPGMQAGPEVGDYMGAKSDWLLASEYACTQAEQLHERGVHKEIVNRILEPFVFHKIVFSSTMPALENFFEQRISPLAQPEINALAMHIQIAMSNSEPEELGYGQWHLPYMLNIGEDSEVFLRRISAARCARVSYLTHDGVRDTFKDLELYDKLVSAAPPHWSPLEHVATPDHGDLWFPKDVAPGNFDGWSQLRHLPEYQ